MMSKLLKSVFGRLAAADDDDQLDPFGAATWEIWQVQGGDAEGFGRMFTQWSGCVGAEGTSPSAAATPLDMADPADGNA